MEIPLFLAISQQEMASCPHIPQNSAWLGCHFSETTPDLVGLPIGLPENSFLILDDSVPITNHNPERIAQLAARIVSDWNCKGIVLDFQRPPREQSVRMVQALLSLPCPVGVAEPYAGGLDCPVFLPPIPTTCVPEEFLKPWCGREIWLDLSFSSEQISVTGKGSHTVPRPPLDKPLPHRDEKLCCHYGVEIFDDEVRFTLRRTREDLQLLAQKCATCGATLAFGLYQELGGK